VIGTAAVIVLVVIGLILWSRSGPTPAATPRPDVGSVVVDGITRLDPSSSLNMGAGGLPDPLKPTHAAVVKGPDGRILVTYVGAEYCPYCAAERWSLVIALSRFGTFSNLQLTRSSSTDIYPNTPTFTFAKASYASSAIDFSAAETADRNQQPLRQPSAAAQAAMAKYDPAGSIPFLDIGGLQYEIGSAYVPDAIAGEDWQQVLAQVSDFQSPVSRAIVGYANWLTAGMCKAGATGDACSNAHIQTLQGQLGT
jgi:hypothetical protein